VSDSLANHARFHLSLMMRAKKRERREKSVLAAAESFMNSRVTGLIGWIDREREGNWPFEDIRR